MELGLFILITAALAAWAYSPRVKEWKPMDPFSQWVEYAADRRTIMLLDGNECELLAVRKASRSAKIRFNNKHYNVYVEAIALVKLEQGWIAPDLWEVVDLDGRPGTQPRLHSAPASKHWLDVKPDYSRLHPSFQPKTPTE